MKHNKFNSDREREQDKKDFKNALITFAVAILLGIAFCILIIWAADHADLFIKK
jgi:hypothetical protein